MAMRVMHRLAVKLCTVLRGPLTARRRGPVIALAIIEMMIDVPVEMLRPMEPRTSADEDTDQRTIQGRNSRPERNCKEEPRNTRKGKQAVLRC